ncbi:MAG: urease accessory protein UreE [Synechococcales bacterium]|nr:urease accessory protein UreE [Cyanobacteria bacterium REEB444]MEB3126487.1 urease accessory protein UreE [Synechococcales bacterium]
MARIILTDIIHPIEPVTRKLFLTAEERTRSRHHFWDETGDEVVLRLPRGTWLKSDDILTDLHKKILIQIVAKPEPVITITSNIINLLRGAYHLGNRHIPLEINNEYLRFSPDVVLEEMVLQLGFNIKKEIVAFYPEPGAYGTHSHS